MNRPAPARDFAAATRAARRAVVLDLTRLVRRPHHPTPTGIDRVEYAWATRLVKEPDTRFRAFLPGAGSVALARDGVEAFLAHLGARWAGMRDNGDVAAIARLMRHARPGRDAGGDYLSLSHQQLHDHRRLSGTRGRDGRLFVFVHDAIPSDFPEYARDGGAARHDRRLANTIALADGIIVNSDATAATLTRFAGARRPPVCVAPLGIDPPPQRVAPAPRAHPYFLCIGTIEPRKNHLLLLHIWRAMAASMPRDAIPHLVLVGRRGWENEMVVDLLDRCPSLNGLVEECGRADDAALHALIAGARAVLMPSFAEGFGLPVAEALAHGTPVIASDLPVFREVAGVVPDYRDPTDGPGWRRAILDHALPESPMRAAQVARMAAWRAPRWDDHIAHVRAFIDAVPR